MRRAQTETGADRTAARGRTWPAVSVVMPVRNEERYLRGAVQRILDQRYPGELDVVLAVAPSRDATAAIARQLSQEAAAVRVVENPTGRTPAGLNAAIASTRHPIIVRVDGHGLLPEDYIRTAVETLLETGADNVGGIMVPEGTTDFERAVAHAMRSRIGIGGAPFHVGGDAGPAESVYLGAFRRDVLERLGGFDENFVRAQDWELNHRIRSTGGTVWFTPRLRVTYRPRRDLRELASQFYCSGQWRRQVMRRYPTTVSARYLAAPTALTAIGAGAAVGTAGLLRGSRLALGWLAPSGYATTVLAAALVDGRGLPPRARMWLPVVLATMHVSWGAGFLAGLPRRSRPAR